MELTWILERAMTWLWRASWQASVLVVLVLFVQWVFGRWIGPSWRYTLWLLVVVRLLSPMTPPSAWSLFNYGSAEGLSAAAWEDWTRSDPVPPESETNVQQENQTPGASPATSTRKPSPADASREVAMTAPPDASFVSSTVTFFRRNTAWIWILGVLVLSMRLAWGNYLFALQLRRRRPISDPGVLALFAECREMMEVHRPVTLLEAPELDGPALFGCLRLKLLLPEKMVGSFSPIELRHVFLHELAHIRRWDAAVNWLITILQTLHWFNPVLWLAFRRMRADRELACDQLALARGHDGESKRYGQTVIKILEGFDGPTAIPGLVGILEDKQQIKRRIRMIAQFKRTSPWPVVAMTLLVALSLISLTDAQTKKGAEKLNAGSATEHLTLPKLAVSIESKSSAPDIVKNVPGLTLRKAMDLPHDMQRIQGVSPDGRLLLGFSGNKPFLLDIATRTHRTYNGRFYLAQFSADGQQIIGNPPDTNNRTRLRVAKELVALDISMEKTHRIYRDETIREVIGRDVSKDGKTVLATIDKRDPSSCQIVLISTSDGSARVLKTFEYNFYPSTCNLSPDGRWVVYDFPDGRQLQDLGYGTEKSIHFLATDGSGKFFRMQHESDHRLLGWAPFGDRILFTSNRRGTWDAYTIQVTDGKPMGEPVLLKEGMGKLAWASLGFTRTGAFFYLNESHASDVYIAALDPISGRVQGKPSKATQFEGYNRSPAWSPDGRFLAYISTVGGETFGHIDGILCTRQIGTGSHREFKEAGRVAFPGWSPDGKSLLAVAYRPGQQKSGAYRIDTDVGKSTFLQHVGVFASTSWERGGNSVFTKFLRSDPIMRYDLETGSHTEITISGPNPIDIVLSPNGEQFAFSIRSRGSNTVSSILKVMPVSGGEPRQLLEVVGAQAVENAGYFRGLGWTPDSRYVLFVKGNPDKPNLHSLWRVAIAGGPPEPLGLEMEELREPVISPDGKRIAFTAGGTRSEVWVMEDFLPKGSVAAK